MRQSADEFDAISVDLKLAKGLQRPLAVTAGQSQQNEPRAGHRPHHLGPQMEYRLVYFTQVIQASESHKTIG